jgi:hypothetical protein
MKRRENALKRVRDALTRDGDHDAPCPAQSLTMSVAGPHACGRRFSPANRLVAVTIVCAPSDRVRTDATGLS